MAGIVKFWRRSWLQKRRDSVSDAEAGSNTGRSESSHSQDAVRSIHSQGAAQSIHSQDAVQSTTQYGPYLPPAALIWREDAIATWRYFASPSELSDHFLSGVSSNAPHNRLYTLQSLPLDYVQVFGDHFDVDGDLIDSHANRSINQLIGRARHNAVRGVRVFALDYVEITLSNPASPRPSPVQDLMPEVKKFRFHRQNVDGTATSWLAMFCHVTLITRQNGDGAETCGCAKVIMM
jgi:hypothetical protein